MRKDGVMVDPKKKTETKKERTMESEVAKPLRMLSAC
jgi:hypothetical protein